MSYMEVVTTEIGILNLLDRIEASTEDGHGADLVPILRALSAERRKILKMCLPEYGNPPTHAELLAMVYKGGKDGGAS